MAKPIIGITLDHHIDEEGFAYAPRPWYALRQDYSQIVSASGGIPVFLSYDTSPQDILPVIDGLIISGGDFAIPPKLYGHEIKYSKLREGKERAMYEIELTLRALEMQIPFLGICNGLQVLNVALGGTLIQDIEELRPGSISHMQPSPKNIPYHPIAVKPNTKLFEIANDRADWMVTSTHHQAIDDLGQGLVVSAYAPDSLVEAVELEGEEFVLGVEWHPEYGATELDKGMFKALINASTINASKVNA
ncbi:MAG: gamma-glutamyl-gamma-aminobutyrate hydrolase family protein [Pseudomonadota bacterium]